VANMVMVRIKRMGKQWATCGVPVSPPPELKGKPNAKALCPKLVPGQVIEVPITHNLLNQDCVEQVRRVEPDEFRRPWAFNSAEEAKMANPTKSKLGADQITMGLSLAEGAQRKGRKALAEREAARVQAGIHSPEQAEEDADIAELERMLAAKKAAKRAKQIADDEDAQHSQVSRSRAPRGLEADGTVPRRSRSPELEPEEDDGEDYVPNPRNAMSVGEREDLERANARIEGREEAPEEEPEEEQPVRRRRGAPRGKR
jgi:hypothetical protein